MESNTGSRAANLLNKVPGGAQVLAQAGITPTPVPPVQPNMPPVIPSKKEEYDFGETPTEKETVELKANPVPPLENKDLKVEDVLPDDPIGEEDPMMKETNNDSVPIKVLRNKYKKVSTEAKKSREELEQVRTKLKEFEDGTAFPEAVTQLQQRVAELEPYEKAINFKASAVYREKFAVPLRADQEKLRTIAVENEIDTDVFNRAFAAKNDTETNRILSSEINDPITALEAKGLIKNIKRIQGEAVEAEKDAEGSLARMQEENDRIETERKTTIRDTVLYNSKSAWTKSLESLREDKRFPELAFQEGNTEHNEQIVRPLLTRASQEYGRMVSGLMQHGLTELPEDIGHAIAKMAVLAHQSAVATVQRDAALKRIAELEATLHKTNRVNYPGVNRSSVTPSAGETGSKAVGAANAAKNALARVTGALR